LGTRYYTVSIIAKPSGFKNNVRCKRKFQFLFERLALQLHRERVGGRASSYKYRAWMQGIRNRIIKVRESGVVIDRRSS